MRTTHTLALVALAVALLLAGCGADTDTSSETPIPQGQTTVDTSGYTSITGAEDDTYRDGTIRRYVDREAGIVCYQAVQASGTGLDCISIDETALQAPAG